MTIKLVAIDMDGTLLNEQGMITDAVAETIKRARKQGVYIVLCTGRPLMGVLNYLTDLELVTLDDFVISYNGSLVLNSKSGEVISEYGLSRQDYLAIDTLARQLNVHLHTVSREAIYTSNRDISRYTVNEAFLVDMPLKYRTPEEIAEQISVTKMMMIDEPEILADAIGKIPQHYFEQYTLVTSAPYYLEVLNREASKGAALRELAAYLSINASEIMAIGDAQNDLSMIEYAGLGIAMGNATEEIKAAADHIVASNAEDGVKEAIDRWAMGNVL
ncbi:sugar phosphate phosphatase [Enterococcus florum]|uniref:Sugar phosphate phosphatase n=1 Tax=Enterococcus florum TaxID=2480627 RepID=A0A4P5P418_9ENTE|nr:sugar-phosphatase [Enterococcus florum]GCF92525.1 sugar phosphate phosphatase [Enterococcus florum]